MGEIRGKRGDKDPKIGVGRTIVYAWVACTLRLAAFEGAASLLEPWLPAMGGSGRW